MNINFRGQQERELICGERSTAANRRLAQWRVTWLNEHSTSYQFCGVLTVLCSEIRHCAKRQNVSGKCNKTPFQMTETYIQDKTFDRNDTLTKGEYENCIFNSCNFSDSDLSEFKFIDCTFNGCNFSLAKLNKTAFRDVKFKDCKMLGLRFDTCNEFGLSFSFDGCQLNHSSFYKTKIKKTTFKNSQLQETDFAEADLTSSVFDNCNLTQAVFDHTTLEKADFRTSYNYSIDPEINRIKKARFSILAVSGLLDKYDIDIEK